MNEEALQEELTGNPEIFGDEPSSETRRYELGYLIVPIVAPEALSSEVAALRALIPGTVVSEEEPTMQSLSYPIEKALEKNKFVFDQAYFGSIVFESLPKEAVLFVAGVKKHLHLLRATITSALPISELRRAPVQVKSEEEKVSMPEDEVVSPDSSIEAIAKTDEPSGVSVEAGPEKPAAPLETPEERMDKEIEQLIEDAA